MWFSYTKISKAQNHTPVSLSLPFFNLPSAFRSHPLMSLRPFSTSWTPPLHPQSRSPLFYFPAFPFHTNPASYALNMISMITHPTYTILNSLTIHQDHSSMHKITSLVEKLFKLPRTRTSQAFLLNTWYTISPTAYKWDRTTVAQKILNLVTN